MALEISTLKSQTRLESIDLEFLQKLLQTHPQYSQHKWDTKSTADFFSKPKDPVTQRKSERRRSLEKLIGRLAGRDIPGIRRNVPNRRAVRERLRHFGLLRN